MNFFQNSPSDFSFKPKRGTEKHPLYQKIKNHILEHIESGQWPPETRVPSESELVKLFNVSRMTANRALRELTAEGRLIRVRGVGSFVAPRKMQSTYLEIKNISDEIVASGGTHKSTVIQLARVKPPPLVLFAMNLPADGEAFYSLIVHYSNQTPVQLSERYVNPSVAPDYLKQDFTKTTPNKYLVRVAPIEEFEQIIEASMPDEDAQKWLKIDASEPCLVIHRRTWSRGLVATKSRFLHPGSFIPAWGPL